MKSSAIPTVGDCGSFSSLGGFCGSSVLGGVSFFAVAFWKELNVWVNLDKSFKKELITNLIAYTDDYMSLLTAVLLLKKKYTIEEIIDNYYSNVNLFDNKLF